MIGDGCQAVRATGRSPLPPLLLVFLFLCCPDLVFAHGVEYQVLEGGVGLEIKYDDGSEFSYSEVRVFAPGEDIEFQTGLTDARGRFIFRPDRTGTWRVIASDGMGHGVVAEIEVDEDLTIEIQASSSGLSLSMKLIVGLSLILGLTGVWFWLAARKMMEPGKDQNAHT